ncbi:hypothetical protein BU24DRAFT_426005 [Aaosphaeria arxii CBS 175.79]|uniref:Uncharacterized protein n=1 Tax=Aaosphaeria arxii CBS 175.79 TaxID=1450172 RepID=A0A6A5XG73_9PLEO|nr:uncharacterized protein BU24DRAFT_426005 [Aaosphaeria arxii CBS 175.79]KAF2012168.1 hypothetical protein BU24DRAFT_426005 [Aaosphaeria arxii CBS 175.79]
MCHVHMMYGVGIAVIGTLYLVHKNQYSSCSLVRYLYNPSSHNNYRDASSPLQLVPPPYEQSNTAIPS